MLRKENSIHYYFYIFFLSFRITFSPSRIDSIEHGSTCWTSFKTNSHILFFCCRTYFYSKRGLTTRPVHTKFS